MSRFFSTKYSDLRAYTPGEQPQDMKYIKLNTNESPFKVEGAVNEAVMKAASSIQLYSDPECKELRRALAQLYNVNVENVIVTNGSDEILNFIFMAYGDKTHPFVFPDITYGFYPVFANVNNVPYTEIPLSGDFTIDISKYCSINKNIVIANPNAPTGILIDTEAISNIAMTNPDNIIAIDEAYIDFGGKSAIPLTKKLSNLIVTGTFSKSRSMAGARVGFAIADENIISDLNTIRYSVNPYNVNSFSMNCAVEVLKNNELYMANCKKIARTRDSVKNELLSLEFTVTDSKANFLFAKSNYIDGKTLYVKLKEKGILIRHFDIERIKDYNRITVGTDEQMDILLDNIKELLKERKGIK